MVSRRPLSVFYTPNLSAGFFAAQLRLVFQPLFPNTSRKPDFLAYIEPLRPTEDNIERIGAEARHIPDRSTGLYKVSRLLNGDGTRSGLVINLTDIWRPIDVVPEFGEKCPLDWTTDNAVEYAKSFVINHFYDKNTYKDLKL